MSKPPIIAVRSAADELVAEMLKLGFPSTVERSRTSNASVYIFTAVGDGISKPCRKIKIRVSNHALKQSSAERHGLADVELIVPRGRVQHAIEEIKALDRAAV